jgi:hypothetical protein
VRSDSFHRQVVQRIEGTLLYICIFRSRLSKFDGSLIPENTVAATKANK